MTQIGIREPELFYTASPSYYKRDNLPNLGGLSSMGVPNIDTNNFLVMELLHIINTIPIGLGWIQWLSHFVWHCLIVSSVNFLIKYVDLRFISIFWEKLCIKAFSWLPCLPLLGYKVKNYQIMDLVYGGGCYSNSPLETEFHEKLAKYLRISQPFSFTSYYYYTNQTDQSLNYSPPRPRIIVHYSKQSLFPIILHGSNTSGSGGTNTEFTLYYPNAAVMNEIEEIPIKKIDGEGKETVYFNVLDFKNNILSINPMISNPLIPIKNYQKLDEIIGKFTKIQNCLGYKNVNAISIDGCPGLGKTSFIDYFSNKHRGDYHIYYIDMIKNYKTSFETIFNTIQLKLDDFNRNEMPECGRRGSSGIVLMIDELDKYLDMHLEYLHNKKQTDKQKDKPDKDDEAPSRPHFPNHEDDIPLKRRRQINPKVSWDSQHWDPNHRLENLETCSRDPMNRGNVPPVLEDSLYCSDCRQLLPNNPITFCDLCDNPIHYNPQLCPNSWHRNVSEGEIGFVERCGKCAATNAQLDSMLESEGCLTNNRQQENMFMAGIAPEYIRPVPMSVQTEQPMHLPMAMPAHMGGPMVRPTHMGGPMVRSAQIPKPIAPWALKSSQDEAKEVEGSSNSIDVRVTQDEDLGRSGRYLKKELLYKLFELVNMKVNQPSYLIFCTNNFSSLWSDLSEKHFRHLKALHSRFIKIHFDHINKENLIEILDDINQTFSKKNLDDNYLDEDKFAKLMELIPDNLSMTVREMHHTLIRTMYDIEQFVNIIVGERQGETSSTEDGSEGSSG